MKEPKFNLRFWPQIGLLRRIVGGNYFLITRRYHNKFTESFWLAEPDMPQGKDWNRFKKIGYLIAEWKRYENFLVVDQEVRLTEKELLNAIQNGY